MPHPHDRHPCADLGNELQFRDETEALTDSHARTSGEHDPDLWVTGEYELAELPAEPPPDAAIRPPVPPVPPEPPQRIKVPVVLILQILAVVAGISLIRYWPEDQQERNRIDGLLMIQTRAQALAQQGNYRAAATQYNVFLVLAAKSESHARRLESAVEEAKAELIRLRAAAECAAR